MSQSNSRLIKPLNRELREKLRSTVAITSYSQCVEELVLNAIDAGASCIAVRVHVSNGCIHVIDNGRGMSKVHLENVGKRYHTSKCHSLSDIEDLSYFGYRGEAIASIKETCNQLEIESRLKHDPVTHILKFKAGKFHSLIEKEPRSSGGSSVFVDGLFFNLPVRRKMVKENIEIEQIRLTMEAHALVHNKISFTLRNDGNGSKLLQTHKCSGILSSFTSIFGSKKAESLEKVSSAKDIFKVNGYISTQSYKNKNLQFVYVNKRLILRTKIHKTLNFFLKRSLICKKLQADDNGILKRESDRQPYYVINIDCPLSEYDITFEPKKTLVAFKQWRILSICLEELLHSFLQRHGVGYGVDSLEHILSQSSSISKPNLNDNKSKVVTDITVNDLLHKITTRCARQRSYFDENEDQYENIRSSEEDDVTEGDNTTKMKPKTKEKQMTNEHTSSNRKNSNTLSLKVALMNKKDLPRQRKGKISKETRRERPGNKYLRKLVNKNSMFSHLHKLNEKLKKMSPPKKLPAICQRPIKNYVEYEKIGKVRNNGRKRSESGTIEEFLMSDEEDGVSSCLKSFSPKKRKYTDNRKISLLTNKYHRSREILNDREQAREQYKLYKRRVAKYLFAPSVVSHNIKQETTEIIRRRREKIEQKCTSLNSPSMTPVENFPSPRSISNKENNPTLERSYFPKIPERVMEEQEQLLSQRRDKIKNSVLLTADENDTSSAEVLPTSEGDDEIILSKVANAMNEYLMGERQTKRCENQDSNSVKFLSPASIKSSEKNTEIALERASDRSLEKHNYVQKLEREFKELSQKFHETCKSMDNVYEKARSSLQSSIYKEKSKINSNKRVTSSSHKVKIDDEVLYSKIATALKECFIKKPKVENKSDTAISLECKDESLPPTTIETSITSSDESQLLGEKDKSVTDTSECSTLLQNLELIDSNFHLACSGQRNKPEEIVDQEEEQSNKQRSVKNDGNQSSFDEKDKENKENAITDKNENHNKENEIIGVTEREKGENITQSDENNLNSNLEAVSSYKPRYNVKSLKTTMKNNLFNKTNEKNSLNIVKGYLFKKRLEEKNSLSKELFDSISDDNISDKWKDGSIPVAIAAMSDEKLLEAWGKVKDPCFDIPKLVS